MTHRILQLSDTHVSASGVDADGVDAIAALDRVLTDCGWLEQLDLVLVTGDIADDGSAEGCTLVRDLVSRFASGRGIPHIYTTGNHDRRPGFTEALGSGHLSATGDDIGRTLDGVGDERAAVSEIRGLRIITLDSLVPGAVHGVLSDAQLAALGQLLRKPAPAGSVLALHHPPIHTSSASWTAEIGLRNRAALADVIAGTDVIALLCGHFHAQMFGSLAGAAVWVGPAVVTRVDLTAPPHLMRAVTGAGASVIEFGGPFSPTFHTLHARQQVVGEQVYVVDPATWQTAREEPHPHNATDADRDS